MKIPPPLPVAFPCPKRWEEMRGDMKRRFCEHCQLHVHNLSAMSRRERGAFVAGARGQTCVTYELQADGSMATPPRWPRAARMFSRARLVFAAVLAAVVPFALSACGAPRRVLTGRVAPPRDAAAQPGHAPTHSAAGEARPRMLGTPLPPRP
jgi:hypothetical protein